MSGKGKKKIGYKQFAELLAQAHQKLEILAKRYQELQTYFIAYVEYRGDNIEFNTWMIKRNEEIEAEMQKVNVAKEQANEKV